MLYRPRPKLPADRIQAFLAVIRTTSEIVTPTRTIKEIKEHEPDNRFLECAEAAEADYLVTGNTKHFPAQFGNTRIVTPREFLDLILPELVR